MRLAWLLPLPLLLPVAAHAQLVGPNTVQPTGSPVVRSINSHAAQNKMARDYGAICDGTSHPLSAVYPGLTLSQVQAKFPAAAALTDETDMDAINSVLVAGGKVELPDTLGGAACMVNGSVLFASNSTLAGHGQGVSIIRALPSPGNTTVNYPAVSVGLFSPRVAMSNVTLSGFTVDGGEPANGTNIWPGLTAVGSASDIYVGPLSTFVRISHVEAENTFGTGITINGSNVTLDDATVHDNWANGIYLIGTLNGGTPIYAQHDRIRRANVYHNALYNYPTGGYSGTLNGLGTIGYPGTGASGYPVGWDCIDSDGLMNDISVEGSSCSGGDILFLERTAYSYNGTNYTFASSNVSATNNSVSDTGENGVGVDGAINHALITGNKITNLSETYGFPTVGGTTFQGHACLMVNGPAFDVRYENNTCSGLVGTSSVTGANLPGSMGVYSYATTLGTPGTITVENDSFHDIGFASNAGTHGPYALIDGLSAVNNFTVRNIQVTDDRGYTPTLPTTYLIDSTRMGAGFEADGYPQLVGSAGVTNAKSGDVYNPAGVQQPTPTQAAAVQTAAGQVTSSVTAAAASASAAATSATNAATSAASVNIIVQATPTVAGIVESTPSLPVAGTDASGNVIAGTLPVASGSVAGIIETGTTTGTALDGGTLGAASGPAKLDTSSHVLGAEMPSMTGAVTSAAGGLISSFAINPVFPGSGSLTAPVGSTAQEPGTPTAGMMRFNNSTHQFEFWDTPSSTWINFVTAAQAAAAAPIQSVNGLTTSALVLEQCTLFTSSGTFTKASWATRIRVTEIGGGGGGGKGGTWTTGTASSGGGGGAGGTPLTFEDLATAFPASSVVVGTGGTGSTGGNATAGTGSSFNGRQAGGGGAGGDGGVGVAAGSGATAGTNTSGQSASGATPGVAGTAGGTAGTTSNSAANMTPGIASPGGGSSAAGAAGSTAGTTNGAPTGGGGGAGISSTGTQAAGGNAGAPNSSTLTSAGGAAGGSPGAAGVAAPGLLGVGGGGGGSNATGAGGAGGAGGTYGGAGGGGGAGNTGGGAGGSGSPGAVLICQRATS